MSQFVRASHPVFGTLLIPEAWLQTYAGAWTVLDEDEVGPDPDPLPAYMRDADLPAAMDSVAADPSSAFSVRQRAASGTYTGDRTWTGDQVFEGVADFTAATVLGIEAGGGGGGGDDAIEVAAALSDIGVGLVKVGRVLNVGASGAWDSSMVEGGCVGLDPATGQYAMTYVGYQSVAGVLTARAGLAHSPDGITWTKTGTPILAGTGVTGDPDEGGVTGPMWLHEDGVYYLFYIGLTQTGYEGGTKSICLATSTTGLEGPWTRHGAVISPSGTGWRGGAVWRPYVVKRDATYYLFFNANPTTGGERIGYATATSLMGPWTVDDVNSPVLTVGPSGAWDYNMVGDPVVRRIGDIWIMDYFGTNSAAGTANDGIAVTTDAAFPLGWKKLSLNPVLTSTPGTYDQTGAHKPYTVHIGDALFHYYTAIGIGGRTIALAISHPDPAITKLALALDALGGATLTRALLAPLLQDAAAIKVTDIPAVDKPGVHVPNKTGAATASGLAIGDDIKVSTNTGRARGQIGNTTGNSELLVGQAANRNLLFSWAFNSDATLAYAVLETYGGGNELRIQNNAGAVRVGGTNGKAGFYGTAPIARPSITGSRAGESAASASTRAALVALGLAFDNTTA